MKRFFSVSAVLSLAIASFLAVPIDAQGYSSDATTIPNSSGAVTCTGTNTDGSTATWTVGGAVSYTSAPGAHYQDPSNPYNFLGYYNMGRFNPDPGRTTSNMTFTCPSGWSVDFGPLNDVKNVQYKVASDQSSGAQDSPNPLGTAATPYL